MTTKTEPNLILMADALESLVRSRYSFTQAEADALNSLKTAIFVQVTQKNLDDFGISRPGQ